MQGRMAGGALHFTQRSKRLSHHFHPSDLHSVGQILDLELMVSVSIRGTGEGVETE